MIPVFQPCNSFIILLLFFIQPKNYPFDLVWMANTDDEEFLNHLTDDEGVELRKVPCARVTTTDIAEHMGIPASTYEKWT